MRQLTKDSSAESKKMKRCQHCASRPRGLHT
jgi:hypothetical protein